jgi:hypothetical protein
MRIRKETCHRFASVEKEAINRQNGNWDTKENMDEAREGNPICMIRNQNAI